MTIIECFVAVTVILLLILNVIQHIYFLDRALKRQVIPELEEKGLNFTGYKCCDLEADSCFKNYFIRPFIAVTGQPRHNIVIDVFYTEQGIKKTAKASVQTLFGFIGKVVITDYKFHVAEQLVPTITLTMKNNGESRKILFLKDQYVFQ